MDSPRVAVFEGGTRGPPGRACRQPPQTREPGSWEQPSALNQRGNGSQTTRNRMLHNPNEQGKLLSLQVPERKQNKQTQPADTVGLAGRDPRWISDLQEGETINLRCFRPLPLWSFFYSSNRKRTQLNSEKNTTFSPLSWSLATRICTIYKRRNQSSVWTPKSQAQEVVHFCWVICAARTLQFLMEVPAEMRKREPGAVD